MVITLFSHPNEAGSAKPWSWTSGLTVRAIPGIPQINNMCICAHGDYDLALIDPFTVSKLSPVAIVARNKIKV